MGDAVASREGGMEVEKTLSLPRRFLRVLLVESDNSTRQIIAALLRKCSYRVAAVSDGLKAWETLKERPNSIDLILTEVELPSISGYALLALIMEHDICKNIPVIMMSSQDPVGVVLKCLLKGAADFLIKPVRKNELGNLWRHVWRRQTQAKGYVPENTVAEQEKVEVASENSAAAQSSSSPCMEAESAKMQNMEGLSCLNRGSNYKMSNTQKHDDLMIVVEKSLMPKTEIRRELIGMEPESASCNEPYKSTVSTGDLVCGKAVARDADLGPESNGHANKNIEVHFFATNMGEPSIGALDLIGRFEDRPENTCGNLSTKENTNRFSCAPDLELSLRRFHQTDPKTEAGDEGHTLNHSNGSAFSWYHDGKASRPLLPSSPSDCTELKEAATASYNGLTNHCHPNNVDTQSHGPSLGSQDKTATLFTGQSGHFETEFPGPQLGFIPFPGGKFDSFFTGHGPHGQVFPPIIYTQSDFPPLRNPKGQWEQSPFLISSSLHSGSEIYNTHPSYHPYEKTANHSSGHTVREEDKKFESVLGDGSATPGLSCISSLCDGNLSNKVDSGASENKCHAHDGDATPAASSVRRSVSESVNDNGLGGNESVNDNGLGGKAFHCPSQREAALLKFRLKRKDRCYDKKVRYQSRKRLAEQRPRVKGQFVRQFENQPTAP